MFVDAVVDDAPVLVGSGTCELDVTQVGQLVLLGAVEDGGPSVPCHGGPLVGGGFEQSQLVQHVARPELFCVQLVSVLLTFSD